jgi:hypothetical protein
MTFLHLGRALDAMGWLGLLVAMGGGVGTLLGRRSAPLIVWFVVPFVLTWGAWTGLGLLPPAPSLGGPGAIPSGHDLVYTWALWQVACDQLWPMFLAASLHGLALFHPALRQGSRYEVGYMLIPSAFLLAGGLALALINYTLTEADLVAGPYLSALTLGTVVPCLLCGVRTEDPAWNVARGRVVALYGLSALFVLLHLAHMQRVFLGNGAAGVMVDEVRVAGFGALMAPVAALGLGTVLLCTGRAWRSAAITALCALPVLVPLLVSDAQQRRLLEEQLPEDLGELPLEPPVARGSDGTWTRGVLYFPNHPCRGQIVGGQWQVLAEISHGCPEWLVYADQGLPMAELMAQRPQASTFLLLVRGSAAPSRKAAFRMLPVEIASSRFAGTPVAPGSSVGEFVAACLQGGASCLVMPP